MSTFRHLLPLFTPNHYTVEFTFPRVSDVFSGKVAIVGTLQESGKEVILHSKDLEISEAMICQGNESYTATVTFGDHDECILTTETELAAGDLELSLTFNGSVSDSMHGIYNARASDGSGVTLISTQFESHHAREAFPCIDEPSAKATFDITISAPKEDVILGNTDEAHTSEDATLKTVTFKTTPKMSTYLLAFVIGAIESKEATTKDGTLIRTWATANNIAHTEFALDTAVRSLEYLNDYFAIPYPISKCDLVAIPDFAAGAMENWGLVTFREAALLVDPDNTSLPAKQWVALVIAHELAHQWFGNLVTMQWWTDLWLNEGFASWMEYMVIDDLFPDWNMWNQFITDDVIRGQNLDSLEHSHPVEVTVGDPEEIRNIFDAISYSKGASIIRMLHEYVGAKDFKTGMRAYMQEFAHGNTITSDLWRVLDENSERDVAGFMNAWTSQTGFPLVQLDGDTIQQERFMLNRLHASDQGKAKDSDTWPIALQPGTDAMISKSSDTIPAEIQGATKLNLGQSGFFMAAYDKPRQAALQQAITNGDLAVADRIGLLQESFQISKAGYQSTTASLDLLKAYSNEKHVFVWDIIVSQLADIRRVMSDETVTEAMRPYVANLISSVAKGTSWDAKESDTHFDTLMRPLVLGQQVFAKDKATLEECYKRFETMTKPEDESPDLRGVIYAAIAERGHIEDYETLLDYYNSSNSAQEKTSLTASLSRFKDPKTTENNLSLIKTDTVKNQEIGYWVAYNLLSKHGKDQTWQWLQDNWGWLVETIGSDIMTLAGFPRYVGKAFASSEKEAEVRDFFDSVMQTALKRPVNQAIEEIQWQTGWRERDAKLLADYFSK